MKRLNIKSTVLSASILIFVIAGVVVNVQKQREVDHSKIPSKVELSSGFQRWITNAKNKDFDINADDFRLKEENAIYNTKWLKINSIDEQGVKDLFETTLTSHKDLKMVVWSPSEREFLDYRDISRDGYSPYEVRFYGQKEDKVIDARILNCNSGANCYFDRAYFLDNDVFVISEVSRTINKGDSGAVACDLSTVCEYSFKEHVLDLINNKRLVYESLPFMGSFEDIYKRLK